MAGVGIRCAHCCHPVLLAGTGPALFLGTVPALLTGTSDGQSAGDSSSNAAQTQSPITVEQLEEYEQYTVSHVNDGGRRLAC